MEHASKLSLSPECGRWIRLREIQGFDNVAEGRALCLELGKCFDFMPLLTLEHKSELSQAQGVFRTHHLPSWIWKQRQAIPHSMIFYPGSFNPWHDGHDACLQGVALQNRHRLARQLLVLPDHNPWKQTTRHECPWSFFRSLALRYEQQPFSFYPGFLGLDRPNPTSQWLPKTLSKNRSLLMGADSFLHLERWLEVDLILESLQVLFVVPRAVDRKEVQLKEAFFKQRFPHLSIIHLPSHAFENVSSTLIREASLRG